MYPWHGKCYRENIFRPWPASVDQPWDREGERQAAGLQREG